MHLTWAGITEETSIGVNRITNHPTRCERQVEMHPCGSTAISLHAHQKVSPPPNLWPRTCNAASSPLVGGGATNEDLPMIDIGEDLVVAYLGRVAGCSVVQFNVRTGVEQAEIDVVGLTLDSDRISRVWLCEVSTHTGGLGGYGGDAAGKIRKKNASARRYADTTFPDVTRVIEVWSPKVTPAMSEKLAPVLAQEPDVALIANSDYSSRVNALARHARKETAFSDSPAFRLLQILTRLPDDPLDLKRSRIGS